MFDPGCRPAVESASTLAPSIKRAQRDRRSGARRAQSRVFRPGQPGSTWEPLEARRLMDGSSDLTADISNLLTGGSVAGTYSYSNVTVGKFLTVPSVEVTLNDLTHSGSAWTGTVTVDAGAANLAIGSLTGSIMPNNPGVASDHGLSGTYTLAGQAPGAGAFALNVENLALADANVFTATAAGVSLDDNPSAALGQTILAIQSAQATIAPLNNATVTLTNLDVQDDGFTIGGASAAAGGTITLGKILSITNPTVSAANITYSDPNGTPSASGTLTVGASAASLSVGGGATASVTGFNGTYNFGSNAVTAQATDANLSIGSVLTADAKNPSVTYTPSSDTLALSASGGSLSSTLFPGATATGTGLNISSNGFSVGDATLADPGEMKLGGVLDITGLTAKVHGLAYTAATSAAPASLTGTITVGAGSVSLLPGSSGFTSSVTGFGGTVTLTTQGPSSLSLSDTGASITVGPASNPVLTLATAVDHFTLTVNGNGGEAVNVAVGSATASLPQEDVTGSLTNLTISNAGFSTGTATLSDTGTVSAFGGKFSIANPSVTLNNFGYSTAAKGFSNNGGPSSLTLTATEVDFDKGGPASLAATSGSTTPLSATISFATAKLGDFSFTAGRVTATIGSYLTLSGENIGFDSNPAMTAGDIVKLGSLSATLNLGSKGITGIARNLAIDSHGHFTANGTAGVSFSAGQAAGVTGSSIQFPSWLPITVQSLSVSWPDLADDPADFTLNLSAAVKAKLGGALAISGDVTGLTVDTGLLAAGQFPITGLNSAGLSVSGTFGSGKVDAGVKSSVYLAILELDANNQPIAAGDTTTPVARRVFYGGVTGGLDIGPDGFEFGVGLSQDGPLEGFVEIDAPLTLDPVSGLTIDDFYAGIEFGTVLQTPASPKDLATGAAYTPISKRSLAQWESDLATEVAAQAANPGSGSDPFAAFAGAITIDAGATLYSKYASADAFKLSGDIQISTDGKVLVDGTLTLGNSLSVDAGAFLDLSQAKQGKASLEFYAQAPASAPVLSFYGSLDFAPVMANGVAVPDTVQITIGGEADLTLASLPGGLDVLGTVVFTADSATRAYDLDVSGTAALEPLGASVSLSGHVHFDEGNGDELYGALEVYDTSSLTDLDKAGIDIKSAVAVVRFNATDQAQDNFTLPAPPATSSTPNPVAPPAQTLPANTVDLFIDGDVTLENQVEINGLLYARFTTADNKPELDLIVAGSGPNVDGIATDPADSATATILTSANSQTSSAALAVYASGVVVISQAGLAASLGVLLEGADGLSKAGVTVGGDVALSFTINTLGQDVSVAIPAYDDPSGAQYPGTGTTLTVPGAPAVVGSTQVAATPYFLLKGNGDLYLTKGGTSASATGLDLNGNFDLLITAKRFELDLDDTLNVEVKGKTLFSLGAAGDLVISDAGIEGAVQLTAGATPPGSAADDFQFDATFVVGLNTTGSPYTPANLPSLTLQPGTAEVVATGDLLIGPAGAQFDLNGAVDITVTAGSSGSDSLNFHAVATAKLPLLGNLAVDGDLTISGSGLYGDVGFAVTPGSNLAGASFSGFSLSGDFSLQFNSTNQVQAAGGVSLPADQFRLDIQDADLNIAKVFDLDGSLDLTIDGSGFALAGGVTLKLLGASLSSATFYASIYQDATSVPQLALYAGLNVGGSLKGSGFSIGVNGQADVEVNTGLSDKDTGLAVNGSDLVIPSRTVQVALDNASINALGFTASGSLIATVNNRGLNIEIPQSDPLSISFLKFGQVEAYGDFNSDGTFSLTAEAGYNVRLGTDTAALDLNGSLYVTISNLGFAAGFSGAADLDLSGSKITLAGVSADIAIEGGYFEIDASLTLFGSTLSFKDSLGKAPSPPQGTVGLTFLSIPAYAAAGSDAVLSANINDASGNPIADGNYEWDVTPPSDATVVNTAPNNGYDPIVLDKPGIYTVTLYDDSNNGHQQVAQQTITVADQAPIISTLGLAAVYPTGQNTGVDINPTIVTPVDANDHKISVTYVVYKDGSTTPFAHAYTTANTLEIFADTPASGTTDTYSVTATVNDGYGGVTSQTSSFRTLDINNIVVNTTADRPIDPGYIGADGTMTLRDAVAFADSFSESYNSLYLDPTIHFSPSLAGQTIILNQLDTSSTQYGVATLDIDQAMTIDGSAAPGLTIAVAPGRTWRVFTVEPAAQYSNFTFTVRNLNITGGTAQDAAFQVDGNAAAQEGGAFYVGAYTSLDLFNVALVDNKAIGFGSQTNAGVGRGGAVYVAPGATLFGYNLTIAGNTAEGNTTSDSGLGAAIYGDQGSATHLFQATIVDNSMSGSSTGGAIESMGGTLQLVNSIVANTAGGSDLWIAAGTNVSGSVNNLYDDQAPGGSQAYPSGTFHPLAALDLGTLAARGDAIESVSLLPGSPAIDGGTQVYQGEHSITVDIRGLPRVAGTQVDVGSYESQADVVTNLNSSGPGSFSNAVATDDDSSPIIFAPGLTGVVNLAGTLVPASNITITGPGANLLTVSGDDRVQLLKNAGYTLTISGLTLAHGSAANGGAIDNSGTLTLDRVALLNDAARAKAIPTNPYFYQATGGAIFNEQGASLTLDGDTFADDTIQTTAGFNPQGQVTTFGSGGAIENDGHLIASDDTFADDSASAPTTFGVTGYGVGGAIDNNGSASIRDSTFAFNGLVTGGQSSGDDIVNEKGGSLVLTNSILADPAASVDLFNSGVISGHNNLIMSSTNVPPGVSRASEADPMLRPLGNYGGPTPTLALMAGSPAIGTASTDGTATDQRGYPRTTNGRQDLGAFQLHSYAVTNGNDSGPGSLRQAVADDVDESPIVLAPSLPTINLTSGPIILGRDTTIAGPGANLLKIDGGGSSQLFQVTAGVVASLSGLTLADGMAVQGGAIANQGALTINAVQFSGDRAVGVSISGPGIASNGAGGAILNEGSATLTVTDSTFAGDSATGGSNTGSGFAGGGFGGAIDNARGSKATLIDDTFFNNRAVAGAGTSSAYGGSAFGGAINNDGTIEIVNSTLDKNALVSSSTPPVALAHAGADIYSGVSLTLYNTIAAYGGTADDIDASGRFVGDGNLVMTSSGLPAGLVATAADPRLKSPAYNGGGTQTQALGQGSPALAAGDAQQASGLDQTGKARVVNGKVDIGAVETQPSANPAAVAVPAASTGGAATLGATVAVSTSNFTVVPDVFDYAIESDFGAAGAGGVAGSTSDDDSAEIVAAGVGRASASRPKGLTIAAGSRPTA